MFSPDAVRQNIHIVVAHIDVDGIVTVRTSKALLKLQGKHLRRLAQEPVVGLVSRQTRAVDAGLLARADADGLSALHIADGIGLGILQGDQGDLHVDERRLRMSFLSVTTLESSFSSTHSSIDIRIEGDAVHLLSLDFSRTVIRIDLDHIVVPLFLLFQNFQRLRRVAGSDHTIGKPLS